MKKGLTFLFVALLLCCSAAVAAAAQDGAAPSLALRVTVPGLPSASFHPVPASGGVTQWYTYFARTPGWKEPLGVLPILAVRFALNMEGERAHVRVTVHRGVKFYDVEEFVAEYSVAAGESHVVAALSKFGVEPFKFEVVKHAAAAASPLTPTYLTNSLVLVNAEVDDKYPAVKLLLSNLSPKPVMALKLHVTKKGGVLSTMWPLGREGRPLIEAGGVGEVSVSFGGGGSVKTAGGYAPASPDGITVASALFADGSYEGEVQPAAQAAAYYEGYRVGLARVLELIRRAAAAPGADDPGAVANFAKSVGDMSREVDRSAADRVLERYPELPEAERAGVRSSVEVPLSWLRQDLLSQLERLPRVGGPGFRTWLASREKIFVEWQARLSR